MPLIRTSQSFKDISLSFVAHPVTKDLPILKNEDAIRKSVRNIIQTQFTEKLFDSNFGTNVRGLLFELIDYGVAAIISKQIEQVLEIYEPRISLKNVIANPYFDTNELEITIIYDIIGQEFPTQDYSFILEATR